MIIVRENSEVVMKFTQKDGNETGGTEKQIGKWKNEKMRMEKISLEKTKSPEIDKSYQKDPKG